MMITMKSVRKESYCGRPEIPKVTSEMETNEGQSARRKKEKTERKC